MLSDKYEDVEQKSNPNTSFAMKQNFVTPDFRTSLSTGALR